MTAPIEITLLTQHACAYCDHAKQVLERVGRDYPLRITEIDLAAEEGRRLAERAGVLFAPGVLVDGAPFSFGRLSERKLRRNLAGPRRTGAETTPSADLDRHRGSRPG
ncbi:glutaredoxin family protein [Nocardia asteroides]